MTPPYPVPPPAPAASDRNVPGTILSEGTGAPPAPQAPSVPDTGATGQLLDYLLAP